LNGGRVTPRIDVPYLLPGLLQTVHFFENCTSKISSYVPPETGCSILRII
jgi:hypothetical protein